jgi:uncharacterized protein YjcR
MFNGLMTVREYAEKHNLRPDTVYMWIYRDKIKNAQQIGRDWFIPADTSIPSDKRNGRRTPPKPL